MCDNSGRSHSSEISDSSESNDQKTNFTKKLFSPQNCFIKKSSVKKIAKKQKLLKKY